MVAPVRERGLKLCMIYSVLSLSCRSREGAWIEILSRRSPQFYTIGRSREGAWIEMVASSPNVKLISVAPVRERGLKYANHVTLRLTVVSLP